MSTTAEVLATAVEHHQAGRFQAAEHLYRQILEQDPREINALHLLGVLCHQRGDNATAITYIRQALLFQPDYAEAYNNLGIALTEQGRLDEAVASLQQAVRLNPDHAEAQNNLGAALQQRGQPTEAIVCYGQALRLRPDFALAHNNLGNALKDQGRMAEAMACYERAAQLMPEFTDAQSNLLYTLIFCPEYDAATIYARHRAWNERHAVPLAKFIRPDDNDRSPGRRLRVGYVSANFREHAESFFTVPLLAAHDHQRFEIFCYAAVSRPDSVTARLRSHVDVWRDIERLKDEQVAELIRADQIDILVDLTLHMGPRNFLLLFARKPVPVQVCWLAYQGTTGLDTMDYRLTDPQIDPPGLDDRYYSETSIRLPVSFWCYDPMSEEPAVNALPVGEQGRVTFGCLNNFCKVNASVLRLWAQVLRAVEGSRLLLLTVDGPHRGHTLDLLRQEGIAPERIAFVANRPRAEYLKLYHHIDLGLDTFPYNGQTTTLDAVWMGIPVVTVVGRTAVARTGKSLLVNLGLPELVAQTPQQFVQIAANLVKDLPRLRRLRATLRERLRNSPLMDSSRFARDVEAAYRGMWEEYCLASGGRQPPV
jgi:predicted O-linked N-acetylglucosamine transferase (SPINDLY family)